MYFKTANLYSFLFLNVEMLNILNALLFNFFSFFPDILDNRNVVTLEHSSLSVRRSGSVKICLVGILPVVVLPTSG